MASREDECRKQIGNSAENFAILRHITLNLLKQDTAVSWAYNPNERPPDGIMTTSGTF